MRHSCDEFSSATLERLPRYLRCLRRLLLEQTLRVTSDDLSLLTGYTTAQIRSDLRPFGTAAQRGYGYAVKELYTAVAACLGLGEGYTAICIGSAEGFAESIEDTFGRCGVQVLAFLPEEVDEMYLTDKLRELAPDLAVLAPDCRHAASAIEILRRNGVRAVLNFTDETLALPDYPIHNRALSDDLMLLCGKVRSREETI